MLRCPVCGSENGDLAVVCHACKAFLQSRVDVLDLFATAWGVIENPSQTFHRIALASRKTYTLPLSGLSGISMTLLWLRMTHAGDKAADFSMFFFSGIVVGPVVGVVLVGAMSGMFAILHGRRGDLVQSFRNGFGAISYATIPLVVMLFVVFPVELAIFGRALFGTNPSPALIKPEIYRVLTGIDLAGIAWFAFLFVQAAAAAFELSKLRAYVTFAALLLATASVIGLVGGF